MARVYHAVYMQHYVGNLPTYQHLPQMLICSLGCFLGELNSPGSMLGGST